MISSRAIFKTLTVSFIVLMFLVAGGIYLQSEKQEGRKETFDADKYFSSPDFRVPDQEIGCKGMVDLYCTKLYSKQGRGNLKITGGKNNYWTLQGQTQNNFDIAWFAYYRARLNRQSKLPADLRSALLRRDFFTKLERILQRPSRKQLQFEQGIEQKELEDQVDRAWDHSLDEVIYRRLEAKYPGTHRLQDDEIPQEAEMERSRIRNRLWSEISIALWKGNPNWLKVQKDFNYLRSAFRTAIDHNLPDPELKKIWLEKLDKVKLSLPGQNPVTANQDCISFSRNAYYYPYLNTLTVCAGYFNGGEQIQTLAHELAHAFDYNSRLIDFQQASPFLKDLKQLRKNVCRPKEFNCAQWEDFKTRFESGLAETANYKGEILDFHRCLQKTKPAKSLDDSVFQTKAEKVTRDRISDLTKNSSFFRIASPKLPLPSGNVISNPNYLNPCAYEVWTDEILPIHSELVTLLFFTSALQCEAKESSNPLRAAVEVTEAMSQKLMKVVLQNEGEFSSRDELQSESYSSPPTEKFADRLGSYAVAEFLKQSPDLVERRTQYLASSFWLCDKPSLRSTNYQQFQTLSDFIIDRAVHPDNEERLKDWLSSPIRESLNCHADFEHRECELNPNMKDQP